MTIIERLQSYFHQLSLRKKLRALKIEREFVNLEKARTIGLLYNATSPDHNIIVTKFSELLKRKKKKVTLLGYVDNKTSFEDPGVPLFNKKDLNWKLEPVNDRARRFIEKDFDILINAFIGDNLPLEYIAALSRAKYRVGEYSPTKTSSLELMINLGNRTELQYLLDQISHYLNLINPNEEQLKRNRNRASYAVS